MLIVLNKFNSKFNFKMKIQLPGYNMVYMIGYQYSGEPRRVNRSYEGRGRSELGYLHHLDPVDKQQRQINQVVHSHTPYSRRSHVKQKARLGRQVRATVRKT